MFRKFSDFNDMVTPGLIKVFYYIGLAFVGLFTLLLIIGSVVEGEAIFGLIFAVPVALFGFLMVRVYCELIMVGFKMLEYLKSINSKLDGPINDDSFWD